MASVTELRRVVDIRAKTTGVKEAAGDLKKLDAAYAGVTVESAKMEKATLSVDRQFAALQRRIDPTFRATERLAAAERTLNAAQAQGLITLARKNELLALSAVQSDRAAAASVRLAGASRLGFAGLASGLSAIGGFVLLSAANDAIKLAGELVDTADKIGITTKALQELKFAGAQTGVEFSEMSGALSFFNKAIGEASRGGGDLVKILKANGVEVRDQSGAIRPLNDLLGDYADLVQNAASAQDRTTLVTKAFGRANDELIVLLSGGRAALAGYAAEADRTGQILDEALLRKAEEIGDRWEAWTSRMVVGFQSLVLSVVAGVDTMTTKLDTWLAKLEQAGGVQLGGGVTFGAGDPLLDSINAADPFRMPTSGKGSLAEDIALTNELATSVASVNQELANTAAVQTIVPTLESTAKATKDVIDLVPLMGSGFDEIKQKLEANQKAAEGFAGALASGLLKGEGLIGSLGNALGGLSSKLGDFASDLVDKLGIGGTIGKLVSGVAGGLVGSLVSAIPDLIGSIFGGSDRAEEKAAAEARRSALATLKEDVKSLSEIMAGDGGDSVTAAIRDTKEQVLEYVKELRAAGKDNAADKLLEQFKRYRKELLAEAKKMRQDDVLGRRMGFRDRLFDATNDTSTLEGQLAAFDRQAQREREQEIAAGGQALAALEKALAAERLGIMQDFNDAATEEAKQAAEEINRTARSIVDYVNGLNTGSGSSLSPQDRLAAAQSAYNSQIALAQGGNAGAQATITQYADDLINAARDFYASSENFQSIFNTVKGQLLGLPAVGQATDPVVIELAKVLQAIQATTTAVGGTTTAVQGTTTAVGGTTTAVDAQDPQLIATAAGVAPLNTSLAAVNSSLGTVDYSLFTLNQSITSQTGLIGGIKALNKTLKDDSRVLINFEKEKFWNPVKALLEDIAKNTDEKGKTKVNVPKPGDNPPNPSDDPFYQGGSDTGGAAMGGIIGRLASGGLVGNGVWNRDSVRARYAGGGDIMLAGGEGVINAAATRMIGPSIIDLINRTGRLPDNDNGRYFADQNRVLMAGFRAMIETLQAEITMLRGEVRRSGEGTTRAVRDKPEPKPATKVA